MSFEDIFAGAIVAACGDNPILLFFGMILLTILIIIVPLVVYIGKQWADQKREEQIIFKDIFSRQDETTKSIVAAQTASTEAIIASQTRSIEEMTKSLMGRMNENHDESMAEFNRNERHIECIKSGVIEIKTAVTNHDRRP